MSRPIRVVTKLASNNDPYFRFTIYHFIVLLVTPHYFIVHLEL